tara:strand:- start:285 stop:1562 length:1278 start_codon:yes stop_codon:yes gene_type:complete
MALDFVKGQAVSIGNRVFKKVAGNLPGLLGITKGRGGDTSDFAGITATKYNTKNYSFPIDVEGPPGVGNHGHYIMFMINEQEGAELKFGEREKSKGKETLVEEMASRNIPKVVKELKSPAQYAQTNITGEKVKVKEAQYGLRANTSSIGEQLLNYSGTNASKIYGEEADIKETKPARKSGSTVYIDRAPTVRLDTAITMYMPPSVKVSYGANYSDQEIGAGAELANDVYANIMAGKSSKEVVSGALNKIGPAISETILNGLLATVGAMPGMQGSREAFEMSTGVVQTQRMELAFKGIGKRSFQYDFRMIPKSKVEADEIRKIVFAFKANMLPEFKNGNRSGRKMRVPNTFDIQYMYSSAENSTQENDYLHKISTCVLKNMDVTYGGDRYKTFTANAEGAPPVETSISLQFEELELITKERVHEGF